LTTLIPSPASRRAADIVFRALHKKIMDGSLPAGARIDVTTITADLEVSRTPVREALLKLESEGLIERQAYRGSVVTGIDPGKLEENSALRIELEGLAAALAVTRISAEAIDLMEQKLFELESSSGTEAYSLGVFNQLNREFHSTLYQAAGAPVLFRSIDGLTSEADRFRLHFDVGAGNAHAEHRQILTAVRLRDADAAKQLTQEHILTAYLRMRGNNYVVPEDSIIGLVVRQAGLTVPRPGTLS
jgi:GntR family transcriptional regulator, rspAB operon transcriptional repressor